MSQRLFKSAGQRVQTLTLAGLAVTLGVVAAIPQTLRLNPPDVTDLPLILGAGLLVLALALWLSRTRRQVKDAQVEVVRLRAELEQRIAERTARLVQDLDDRTRAEQGLRESEERFRTLVELSAVGIYIIQQDRFQYVNPQFGWTFGRSPEEVLALPSVLDLVVEADRALVREKIEQRINGAVLSVPYRFRGRRKDGSGVHLEAHDSRVLYKGAPAVIGTLIDLGERKVLEQQARRLERFAALGQLLSGIAHEWRNPLFILTGRLQLAREKLGRQEYAALAGDLAAIETATARLTAITDRFLSLARPFPSEVQRCVPETVLREVLDLLTNEFMRKGIRLVTAFGSGGCEVVADPNQLHEVFLNLILNAVQAMAEAHGGGTLTVETRLAAPNAQPSAPGQARIEIRIQDDGPGIPPEHRPKLFNPFFSTKPPDQSTGLGLWTVRSILLPIGGTVTFETEVGRGTTFIVRLPVAPSSVKGARGSEQSVPQA